MHSPLRHSFPNLHGFDLFFIFVLTAAVPVQAAMTYSGNTMEIDQRNDRIILEGNAHLVDGSNDLRADRVVVMQKEKWARAERNVVLYNRDKKIRYTGGEMLYYYDDGISIATKSPKVVNEKDRIIVTAKVIRGLVRQDKAFAYTNVFVHKYDSNDWIKAWGDEGFFEKTLSFGKLISNCRTEQDKTDTWSDLLTLFDSKKQLFLDGNASINDYDTTNKAKTNNLKAHRVRYDYQDKGRAFYAYTNILLTDGGDGSQIGGNFLKNIPDTKYTYVLGNAWLLSGDKIMTLSADLLERFDYSDLLYAKGNVKISNENRRAYSSMAIYSKNEKKTVLYGNPRLEDASGVLYAERISFKSADNNFRMEGQIRGAWGKL